MKSNWGNQIWPSALVLVAVVWFGLGGTALSLEFSDEEKEQALELIGKLEADGFAEREAAMKSLEALPASALPWLGEMVEAPRPTEIELRSRLKSIVRTLKKRDAQTSLKEGTKVMLKLDSAKPESALEALEKQIGSSLKSRYTNKIWDKIPPEDLEFEGTYWEAIDTILEAFPPPKGGREDLAKSYRFTRWGEADFKAAHLPSVTSGILRVRHARLAMENNGGKDSLVLNLVPSVEPRYQVEELSILIKGIVLEDGSQIEPVDNICKWESERHGSGARYNPSSVYTWIFPLEKGMKVTGVAGVEGVAELSVRRLDWVEIDLPEELNEKVKMNGNIELEVLERDEARLKIQFTGNGSKPECFDDYEMRHEAYKLMDAEGEELEFNVNSTSSGGGNGWRKSFAGSIKGDPVKLKSRLPGGAQKVQLKFDLVDLPVPGSSLAD